MYLCDGRNARANVFLVGDVVCDLIVCSGVEGCVLVIERRVCAHVDCSCLCVCVCVCVRECVSQMSMYSSVSNVFSQDTRERTIRTLTLSAQHK